MPELSLVVLTLSLTSQAHAWLQRQLAQDSCDALSQAAVNRLASILFARKSTTGLALLETPENDLDAGPQIVRYNELLNELLDHDSA